MNSRNRQPSSPSLRGASAKRNGTERADLTSHKVGVTFFQDHTASTMSWEELTLTELGNRISEAMAPTKQRLPWLKGAKFGDQRTEHNSLRSNDNVLTFNMIHLDYDQEAIAFK